jgi:alpha-aminoadipic semialdehyde synthase
MAQKTIGIRMEDKYIAEKRVAIIPEHVKKLIENENINVEFIPSIKRCFSDEEYLAVGAKAVDSLHHADIIVGVKEIPETAFEAHKTYLFFSHTIKGQHYNMKMLKRMMELKCNLIDYERVVNEHNQRLIFFGRFAGLAGAINSLWTLGLRWKEQGFNTPLSLLQQSFRYTDLQEAKNTIKNIGNEIATKGLPAELLPLTIGITGYGNVSKGAQEIIDLLPIKEITPTELLETDPHLLSRHFVYKVVFKEKDLYKRRDDAAFDLTHFFHHPAFYQAQFAQYAPHLTLLLNCIYWNNNYDRIVTKQFLRKYWKQKHFKLTVIGDISCDPNGSIEATHQGTEIATPIFIYHPDTEIATFGHQGDGIAIMAVDILPSELPRDASVAFSEALFPFLSEIIHTDFEQKWENLTPLSYPIRKALILHQGELTQDYCYLNDFLHA